MRPYHTEETLLIVEGSMVLEERAEVVPSDWCDADILPEDRRLFAPSLPLLPDERSILISSSTLRALSDAEYEVVIQQMTSSPDIRVTRDPTDDLDIDIEIVIEE